MIQHAPSERFIDRLGGIVGLIIVGAFLMTILAADLAWVFSP
jgi:hypothetical protein